MKRDEGPGNDEAVRCMAVVDIGTNSVRLFAVEFGNETIRTLDDYGATTRLGAGLARDGAIREEDAARTLQALETCLSRAAAAGAETVDLVGTEVFRAAANGSETAAAFSKTLGRVVRILSADEEAEASYLGVVGWEEEHDPGPALILDVGGGSTELVLGEGVVLRKAKSLPVGALRVAARFFEEDPPAAARVEEARIWIDEMLARAGIGEGRPLEARAIGVGGTACAIGASVHGVVPYDPERVHGRSATARELASVVERWSSQTRARIMAESRMSEGRAAIVLGGALVFERLMKALHLDSFRISTRGLRHGLILRRLLLA